MRPYTGNLKSGVGAGRRNVRGRIEFPTVRDIRAAVKDGLIEGLHRERRAATEDVGREGSLRRTDDRVIGGGTNDAEVFLVAGTAVNEDVVGRSVCHRKIRSHATGWPVCRSAGTGYRCERAAKAGEYFHLQARVVVDSGDRQCCQAVAYTGYDKPSAVVDGIVAATQRGISGVRSRTDRGSGRQESVAQGVGVRAVILRGGGKMEAEQEQGRVK